MSNSYEYISIEGFRVKVSETVRSHNMKSPKGLTWPVYCQRCGLIALKNKVSQKALQKGCIEMREEVLGKV